MPNPTALGAIVPRGIDADNVLLIWGFTVMTIIVATVLITIIVCLWKQRRGY
jgi:heme/copper-type cytochrome/quinol oxidase subunit 2